MYGTSSAGGYDAMVWLGVLIVYLYFAFAQYKIAQKLKHENTWFAFIPILGTIQLIQMARKPLWWFVLCLIPIVNVICYAVMWMDVAKYVGHPPILGFLVIIPLVNLVTVGIMAFSAGHGHPVHPTQPEHVAPRQPERVV